MYLSWNEIRVRAASFVQEWWNTVCNRTTTPASENSAVLVVVHKWAQVAQCTEIDGVRVKLPLFLPTAAFLAILL